MTTPLKLKQCNMNKVQQEQTATSATGEESKKKTLQRVKVQYELVQI